MWAAGNAWILLDWEQRVGRTATEDDVEPLTWALVQVGRSLDSGRYLHVASRSSRRSPARSPSTSRGSTSSSRPPWGSLRPRWGRSTHRRENRCTGLFRAAAYVPFTPPFNVTGQPGISLPLHWNDEGLPIGVQFVGRFGDEETLSRLAGQLETRCRGPAGGHRSACDRGG